MESQMTASKQEVDVNKIIGQVFDQYELKVTNNDAILYALSIGFS